MTNIEFRLNEFKAIARWLDKKLSKPLAFFFKGWLYALESAWIDAKVSAALEKALAPHRATQAPLVEPTHYTEPSDVDGLDIIGYTYEFTRTRDQDEGGLQSLPDTGLERAEPTETD